MSQLQQSNIFYDVQKEVCKILNSNPELSSICFIEENKKDIENDITQSLRKQGICGVVIVEDASYLGIDSGIDTAWQIDNLIVQIVENPIVNRSSQNTRYVGTAQDIGTKVSQVLGGAEYGHQSMFNLKTYECGEDSGLLVSKVTFRCIVTTDLSSYVPPEHPERRIPFVDYDFLSSNYYDKDSVDGLISEVEDQIPTKTSELVNDSGFLSSHQSLAGYATESWVEGKRYLTEHQSLSSITELIPSQATSQNKLADKSFVNSSITTNTAFFKGTFNSISDLPTSGVTNNDYAFVTRTDAIGQTFYDRYKYNSQTSSWIFEYSINNSGFTSVQYAAINSGITSQKVTAYDGYDSRISNNNLSVIDIYQQIGNVSDIIRSI